VLSVAAAATATLGEWLQARLGSCLCGALRADSDSGDRQRLPRLASEIQARARQRQRAGCRWVLHDFPLAIRHAAYACIYALPPSTFLCPRCDRSYYRLLAYNPPTSTFTNRPQSPPWPTSHLSPPMSSTSQRPHTIPLALNLPRN
jgi:hypothetical protein